MRRNERCSLSLPQVNAPATSRIPCAIRQAFARSVRRSPPYPTPAREPLIQYPTRIKAVVSCPSDSNRSPMLVHAVPWKPRSYPVSSRCWSSLWEPAVRPWIIRGHVISSLYRKELSIEVSEGGKQVWALTLCHLFAERSGALTSAMWGIHHNFPVMRITSNCDVESVSSLRE
jgi:hypothetical protein